MATANLCPLLALLSIAPHPLTAEEIAPVLDLRPEDVLAALSLMEQTGRAVRLPPDRWRVALTEEVGREAGRAVRSTFRERQISAYAEMVG